MACRRHRNAITEVAMVALDPAREAELATHLTTCADCRASLERERRLLATIDRNIRASLATELSPGFAARLRGRLAEEQVEPRFEFGHWMCAAAGALTVVALAIVWLARPSWITRSARPSSGRETMSTRVERDIAASRNAEVRPAQSESLQGARAHSRVAAVWRKRANLREPRVLVEKSQWAALIQLYNEVWSHPVDGASLVKEASAETNKGLELVPLKIEPLVISKIESDASAGPAQTSTLPRL